MALDVYHFATTHAFMEPVRVLKPVSVSPAGVALPATSPVQMASGVKLVTGTARAKMVHDVTQ